MRQYRVKGGVVRVVVQEGGGGIRKDGGEW